MAGSVNRVILVGNLGKDPEVRAMQNGAEVVNLTLATGESWTDKQTGEKKERTEWHRLVIFNERLIEFAKMYLQKGRKIYIEGSLQTRKWTDQQGQERYSTEIVLDRYRGELQLLDKAPEGQGASEGGGRDHQQTRTSAPRREAAMAGAGGRPSWPQSGGDLDDAIPFGPCWQ